MRYVILGGSSGVGRALARCFAAAGNDLIVVSSDQRDVNAMAEDLSIRYGSDVLPLAFDIADLDQNLALLRSAIRRTGEIDGLFFPVGAVLKGDDGTLGSSEANWLTSVNFLSVATIVAAFLPVLEARPSATIAGFGSVAALRGRRNNVVYAAAKRALASYVESLRHRCAGSNVTVQFYVLGYMDTALAFGRTRGPIGKGDPDALSKRVLDNIGRDVGVVYYPKIWRAVCAVLWMIPWSVFKRLSF